MIDPLVVEELIDRALAEDIGFADLTSELVIPAGARAELALNARQDIVVAGVDVAAQVFRRHVPECRVELRVKDGDRVNAGTAMGRDRKSTRLNSSHANISYAVFCLKKKNRAGDLAVPEPHRPVPTSPS